MVQRAGHDPTSARRVNPLSWPLWLVLLLALAIRLAFVAIDGSGYDIQAFQEWTRQMLAHPLDQFYAADLNVPQDHLPGDLWVLYALGTVWTSLGGGAFAGTGAAMIALKLVPIALDLVLGLLAAAIVRPVAGDRTARLVLLAILFNPGVMFISSIWGQWNVLATVLIVGAILLMLRYERSGVGLALPVLAYATLVKPQVLVLLVPVAVLLARRWRAGGSWRRLLANVALGGAASVVLVLAAILPFDVGFPGMGTRWTILDRVQFAADRYTTVTKGAYNAWRVVFPDAGTSDRLSFAGATYQHVGFGLLGVATIYAVIVAWRATDANVGLIIAMAIVATSLFMVVTRAHERYLLDGTVLTIIAAGIVPRLRPAAWGLSAALLLNMWFGWGYWHPTWVAHLSYTDAVYRGVASVSMIGFALLLWGAWPRSACASAPAESEGGSRNDAHWPVRHFRRRTHD